MAGIEAITSPGTDYSGGDDMRPGKNWTRLGPGRYIDPDGNDRLLEFLDPDPEDPEDAELTAVTNEINLVLAQIDASAKRDKQAKQAGLSDPATEMVQMRFPDGAYFDQGSVALFIDRLKKGLRGG